MTEKRTDLDISIEEVSHAVAEITKMDAVITALTKKYENVIFDVDTQAGMNAAKSARKEIRDPRYLIENMRKDGKAPILNLGRRLDGRANEMKDRLLAIENPIDSAIKEEETRVERERQARIDAEIARVERIQGRITEIRGAVSAVNSMGLPKPEKVQEFINDVEGIKVDKTFDEFERDANEAKASTLALLREALSAAKEREAEAVRVAAEREELAKLREAEEKRQAEERAKQAAIEAEARKKREAEEKKQREALEAQRKEQAEAQKKIDEENAKLEADRKAKAEAEEVAAKRKIEAEAEAKKARYPGTDEIISVLAKHFKVSDKVVRVWLNQIRDAA